MSIQILRIVGIVVGGTLGGYISGKIGEYINNKKKPQIENKPISQDIKNPNISNNEIKVNYPKINSFDDLLKREIELQKEEQINQSEQVNPDSYYLDYIKALEIELEKQEEEKLFVNDAIYDGDFYDYFILLSK